MFLRLLRNNRGETGNEGNTDDGIDQDKLLQDAVEAEMGKDKEPEPEPA